MSLLDNEQQAQVSPNTSLSTDESPSAYNAEAEEDTNNQTSLNENKPNFVNKFLHKLTRNKKFYSILIIMYQIIRELTIMFFIALAYAVITNNPPKISKSPPAVPFFPQSSIVEDWYRGELTAALAKARQFDIAFIMFYAPWDAECQSVRHEFDLAARHLHNDIVFLAVNCWQPGSECRNQYVKAYNWPILIAYMSHGKGVHYKGINSAPYMVKFLITLSRPLIRIYEQTEITTFTALNDVVVAGCLNSFPGSSDYSALYNAAINLLESNPNHGITFVVLTGINNTCIDSINDRALSLYLWNETLLYPSDEKWKSEAIVAWIDKVAHQVSGWTLPSGKKSYLLSVPLQPGPTLILFTPKNPLAITEDYYNLLHEVALEYHNCEEDNGIKLNSEFSFQLRIENYLKHKKNVECGIHEKINKNRSSFCSTVTYVMPDKWTNNSCCNLKNENCKESCSKSDTVDILKFCKQDCSNMQQHHRRSHFDMYKDCDINLPNKLNLRIDGEFDPLLPSNLQKVWEERKCQRAKLASKVYPNVYSETISNFIESDGGITFTSCRSLACKTNASLSFIALDSLQHHHFAERLGVDLYSKKHITAAVIVDDKMEMHHIMQEIVNDETLRQFVVNFTTGHLDRAINFESDVKPTHTHVYSSKKTCGIKVSSEFCLTELNSETFLPTVLQKGQVVLVFYYSRQCSFCSGISYTYLTVAKMFSSVSAIKFVRIDGDLNTLPWEFTMERYPTILFFPFRRKAETRVFPRDMSITVPNLLGFILSNLNPTLKLQAMWTICNQTKLEEDRLLCIASIRTENLSLIDRTLQVWRNANILQKSKLLYKLQQLRNINLLLALYPQNNDDLSRYVSQLHWSSDEHAEMKDVNRQNNILQDEL